MYIPYAVYVTSKILDVKFAHAVYDSELLKGYSKSLFDFWEIRDWTKQESVECTFPPLAYSRVAW